MAHQRKLIRDAVVTRLKTGGTMAGQNVFGNRSRPLFPHELPAILVYSRTDAPELSNEAPREYKRTLTLGIECVAAGRNEEELDDILDEFCAQVESAIFKDETFGGLVSDTLLGDTELDILANGDKPAGGAKILLSAIYYQRLPEDLTGDLDDFKKMGVKVDLPPADGVNELSDVVTAQT